MSACRTCRYSTRSCTWPNRVQVVRSAGAFRQLAYALHTHEPMVEERCARPGVRAVATGADGAHPGRGVRPGQHQHQGASRRHGGAKENGPQAIGKPRGGWNTRLHMVAADARTAVAFALSPGHAHDAPQGRRLLNRLTRPADSSWTARTKTMRPANWFVSGVSGRWRPPKRNRLAPWSCDKALYKRRNEIERLFRRLKGFRRIFSRFDKLDVMFLGFVTFGLIIEFLRLR